MYSDLFIKLPIQLYSVEQAELTGKEDAYDSWIKVRPMEIIGYRPSTSDGEACTLIHLRHGATMIVFLSPERFEELLNKKLA